MFYFVINACILHVIITLLRYFLIPKFRDLVSHNPGISGLKNGPGSGIPGLQSLLAKSKLSCMNNMFQFTGFQTRAFAIGNQCIGREQAMGKARKSGKRNVKRNINARCLQIQHCLDFEMK